MSMVSYKQKQACHRSSCVATDGSIILTKADQNNYNIIDFKICPSKKIYSCFGDMAFKINTRMSDNACWKAGIGG